MKKSLTLLLLVFGVYSYAQDKVSFNFALPALTSEQNFEWSRSLPIKSSDNELVRRKALQLLEEKVKAKDFSQMYTYADPLGDGMLLIDDSIYHSTMSHKVYLEEYNEENDEVAILEVTEVLTVEDLLVRPQFLLAYNIEKQEWTYDLIQLDYCWFNPEIDPDYPLFLFTYVLNKELKNSSAALNFNAQLDYAVSHHLYAHADFIYNVSFLFTGEVNADHSEVMDYRARALKFYIDFDAAQTLPYSNLIDSNRVMISEDGNEMTMKQALTDSVRVEVYDMETGESTGEIETILEIHGNRSIAEVFNFELDLEKMKPTLKVVGLATANYSYSDELIFRFFWFK